VTPMDPEDGVLPRMDAHIHGPWMGTLGIQGPWTADSDDERPVVFHESADRGTTMSLGNGTAVSTVDSRQTVTALTSSLSTSEWGSTACPTNPPSAMPGVGFCLQDLTDGSLQPALARRARVSFTG
jgi:hypothetical protein